MNRQGNWKVNWSAELKYFGELNVQDVILQSTTVETCPCEQKTLHDVNTTCPQHYIIILVLSLKVQ